MPKRVIHVMKSFRHVTTSHYQTKRLKSRKINGLVHELYLDLVTQSICPACKAWHHRPGAWNKPSSNKTCPVTHVQEINGFFFTNSLLGQQPETKPCINETVRESVIETLSEPPWENHHERTTMREATNPCIDSAFVPWVLSHEFWIPLVSW